MSSASPSADSSSGLNASGVYRLTVLGTTDLHGHVFNFDYVADREYDDDRHNDVGLAKIATLIRRVRAERGENRTITLDAGDTIQGTALAYYYARVEPVSGGGAAQVHGGGAAQVHPMAAAMNAIGYDAAALGNHEFNFGLPVLRAFESQLRFPLLGANARDWHSGEPAFGEYVIKTVDVGRDGQRLPVRVGLVGLVTPGCAVWDRGHVQGAIRFEGIVERGASVISEVRRAGADVVIVSCHSGADTSSSYGDALPFPENAAGLLAEQVPGIDAILVGHAHTEIVERFVTNAVTGRRVLLSEPLCHGMRLSVMDLDLALGPGQDGDSTRTGGSWTVTRASATLLNANTVDEDAEVATLLRARHETVRGYSNTVVGRCVSGMSARAARYQDSAITTFVNHVQASAVRAALVGTEWAPLPVLSVTAPPFSSAAIPAGDVRIGDLTGVYPFDNTLLAVLLTGEQLRAHLEHAAAFYRQVAGDGPLPAFGPYDLTHAPTPHAPRGMPDYSYDIAYGLDAAVSYRIDVARPVGSRIVDLRYGGAAVADDARFVVAVNNYRQSGAGGYPHVAGAPVLYDGSEERREVRTLLVDWLRRAGSVDPARFTATNWQVVAGDEPVRFHEA